jgi:hypothetical protein
MRAGLAGGGAPEQILIPTVILYGRWYQTFPGSAIVALPGAARILSDTPKLKTRWFRRQ